MAIYRLSVQTIRRGDGRSVVAAAAYRAGVRLHDERLEMEFDFRRKEGIEHREVMGPATAPAALLEREALWNAAERSDRRKDSVPAQEVLIALPHELNAEQRRELVRSFVRESLVSRGMIADFNIHQPDAQGDQRNFHAHILVTTRDVAPAGFGKKNPEWNHASFVSELRHEWARVQNREMQRYLGPDAPKVSEKSLAERGINRNPSPKMGPAATAIERRGERSEIGARRDAARFKQAELDAKDRDLARQMRPENTPWRTRPTTELLDEMIALRRTMRAQRDQLLQHRETLQAPRAPSKRQLENALTKREVAERKRAEMALKHAREEATKAGISASTIAKWFVDPSAAFKATLAAAHRELDRIDKAQRALEKADRTLIERRAWVRSEAGQALIENLREPGVNATVEMGKKRRTADRRIKRLDARIRRANSVIRDLGVAKELSIKGLKVPSRVPTDGRRDAGQDRHLSAIGRPAQAVVASLPTNLVQAALRTIKARAVAPPTPPRGPDLDIDR